MTKAFRVRAAFAAAMLLASSLVPAPVAAVEPTVSLQVSPAAPNYLNLITFTATVSPHYEGGSVTFWKEVNDGVHSLGYGSLVNDHVSIQIAASIFDTGTHGVYATANVFDGNPQSPTVNFTVSGAPSQVTVSGPFTVPEAGNSFMIRARATANYTQDGGTMTFYRQGVAQPLCTDVEIGQYGNQPECEVPGLPAGTYTFLATYSGTSRIAGSTGQGQVTVLPDPLYASGVALQYTTFYPVKDSYKDTVAATGFRGEPISVTVRVYSPAGTLLKTVSIASGTTPYSYAWNGRKADGTIYAEGKYKITQTLTDGVSTKTFTHYVNLSKKKLYRYSKTITKLGSSYTAKGTLHSGLVTRNTTSGYTKLYAPGAGFDWAAAGWEFTVPTATIYESIVVRMYGRHSGASSPVTRLGAQNFKTCAYSTSTSWRENCFGFTKNIPTTSGTTKYWYSSASNSNDFRSGTKIRMMVSSFAGTTYIYKAQIVVKYGILKY